jgi:rRNA maturation endonuclease Nob1
MPGGVLQFLTTLAIYFLVFAAIGMLFYGADTRVRRWLRRPLECPACSAKFDASLLQKRHGRCPGCGRQLSVDTSKAR